MVMLPTCLDCIPPEVGSISLEQRDGEQGDLSKAIAVTPLSISSIEAPGAIAQAEFSERTPDPSSPVPATPLHKEWTPVPLEPHHQTPASTPQSILRLGSRGEAVQALQTQLQQRGYYTDSIDGIFGRRTQAAVRAWQRSQNLTPDGVVGSNTWATFAPPAPEAPLKPFTTQPSLATPKAEAPELPSESPPRPQTQQPSPIIFATDSPSYAPWFLGWGVIYGAGWVIIIRDGVQQRQVKRSKRSTPIETPLAQPPPPPETTPTAPEATAIAPPAAPSAAPVAPLSPRSPVPLAAAPFAPVAPLLPPSPPPEIPLIEATGEEIPIALANAGQLTPQDYLFPYLENYDSDIVDLSDEQVVARLPATATDLEEEVFHYSLVDRTEGLFVLRGNELRVLKSRLERYGKGKPICKTITIRRTSNRGEFIDKSFNLTLGKTA